MHRAAGSKTDGSRRVFLRVIGATTLAACGGRPGSSVDDGTPSDPDPADGLTPVDEDDTGAPVVTTPCGVDRGAADSFAPGRFYVLGSGSTTVIIGNDDGTILDVNGKPSGKPGLFAMSGRCTHALCTLQPRSTGSMEWYCPCHRARFDYFGNPDPQTARIAKKPLPHYALSICDGHVFVDFSKLVDAGTRTAT